MGPDAGVEEGERREISSTIGVSLMIHCMKLRILCSLLRDIPSLGRRWRSF
jgi:hypothetical protein